MFTKEHKFNFNIPVDLLEKNEDGDWKIGGIASTENKDFQGETVKIDGLDISTLSKNGFFNQDHKKGFENILGKVQKAEKRSDEDNGKHLYVEGRLFKTQPAAKAAWNIMNELEKGEEGPDTKKMQLSVEGKIIKREGKDKKVVAKAKVENVALTLNPINNNTFATLLKSMEGVEQENNEIEKSKKYPIGTVRNGRKKVGEGKWVEVTQQKQSQKTPEPKNGVEAFLRLTEKHQKDIINGYWEEGHDPAHLESLGTSFGISEEDEENIKENPEYYQDKMQEYSLKNPKQFAYIILGSDWEDILEEFKDDFIKKSEYQSDPPITVRLKKSTYYKLLEYQDSKKDLKKHIYDLCKGMNKEERDSFFRVLIKTKDRMNKALTATHSYATQLPTKRTGGDVHTQESLDTKKRNSIILGEDEELKRKMKKLAREVKKSFPDLSVSEIVGYIKKKMKDKKKQTKTQSMGVRG